MNEYVELIVIINSLLFWLVENNGKNVEHIVIDSIAFQFRQYNKFENIVKRTQILQNIVNWLKYICSNS